MRVPNGVFAAKCSDRWIGLRSPVSCAKPTTSEDEIVFDSVSVMPTDKSSNQSRRSSNWLIALAISGFPAYSAGEAHGKQREPRRQITPPHRCQSSEKTHQRPSYWLGDSARAPPALPNNRLATSCAIRCALPEPTAGCACSSAATTSRFAWDRING